MAKDNTLEVTVMRAGRRYSAETRLRDDMILRSLPQMKGHIIDAAHLLAAQLVKEITENDHEQFCIQIRVRESKRDRPTVVGHVIIGGPRAQGAHPTLQLLTGKRILFCRVKEKEQVYHAPSHTVYVDAAAWKVALTYDIQYLIVYIESLGQLWILHYAWVNRIDAFDDRTREGRFLRARAWMLNTRILAFDDGVGPHTFTEPKPEHLITVEREKV